MNRLRRYAASHIGNFVGAGRRLARQPLGSGLTVTVIAIALALPAGLEVMIGNAGALSGSWQSAADFTVYLDMDVTADEAEQLGREIAARDDVAAVDVVTREAALARFRVESGFGEALDALNDNPLPHAIVVRPAGGATGAVEPLVADLRALDATELVQIDTEWVARLRAMLELAGRVVVIVGLLLGLAVVLVIGNTIRLEINNRSVEIEVMKLVGGSDGFIRRPFLYLGLWYGFAGALGAALLVAVSLALIEPAVRDLAALYASGFELTGLGLENSLLLVATGAALGWAGAWLAAARHLRAIEPR